jgi:hypothetical protein
MREAKVAAEPWSDNYFNMQVSLVEPGERAVPAPVL